MKKIRLLFSLAMFVLFVAVSAVEAAKMQVALQIPVSIYGGQTYSILVNGVTVPVANVTIATRVKLKGFPAPPVESVSFDGSTITWRAPMVPQPANCRIRVTGFDQTGKKLFKATSAWFQIQPDPPPTVISTWPTNGATGVSVNSTVSVTLSEPVACVNIFSITGTVACNGATITLTPASSWSYGATAVVSVFGATDISGNVMAGGYSWSFSTEPAPSIMIPEIFVTNYGTGNPTIISVIKSLDGPVEEIVISGYAYKSISINIDQQGKYVLFEGGYTSYAEITGMLLYPLGCDTEFRYWSSLYNGMLYVSQSGCRGTVTADISIYNASTGELHGFIPDITERLMPHFSLVNEQRKELYSVNCTFDYAPTDNNITVVDLNTNTIKGRVDVGRRPYSAIVSHLRAALYVPNMQSKDVSVVDLNLLQTTQTFPISGTSCPLGSIMNPDESKLYVTDSCNDELLEMNPDTGEITARIPVGDLGSNWDEPAYMVYDPVTNLIFITLVQGNAVAIVDAVAKKQIMTKPVRSRPIGIAMAPRQ